MLSGTHERDANQIVHEMLQKAASVPLGDWFAFSIGSPVMDLDAAPYGGARYPVEARMDARIFARFHLDMGIGDAVMKPLEAVEGRDWLEFAGIGAPPFRMIPSEQQFAEKLHAYTLPRSTPNSRVKDLIDLLLLIRSGKLAKERLPLNQGNTNASAPARSGRHNLSEAEAPLEHGMLTVWVPGTFARGGSEHPVDFDYHWDHLLLTKFKHDFPNFDLGFEVMEGQQLEEAMHSPPDQHFPEVVFIENYREYRPLQDANAVVTMWGRSRFEWHGRWVIFRQTTNFAAAEAFLLWLEHPFHFKPSWSVNTNSIGPADVAAVQAFSEDAVRDYVKEDPEALWSVMDPAAARFQAFGHDGPVTLLSCEPLLTFGNSRLAFVLLTAMGEGDKTIGMNHSGMILRNTEEGWKVLYLVPGDSLPRLEDLFSSFDRLGLREEEAAQPVPEVKLIGPPDHSRLPQFPYPKIEWAPVDAPLATYVFEFQGRLPGKERWSPSEIILCPPVPNEPTLHWGWSDAPGRWRVWAISKAGVVSISEWRVIDYTY